MLFKHHLHSCSFPDENVWTKRTWGDTCRRTEGVRDHAVSNGPYSVLATVLCIILKCGQEVSAKFLKTSANTFLIMFYVQSIVIIINTLLETYKNIILLTCILGCQVWILTWTLRILRGFMVFLNPFANISSYYSTKISLHTCLRSLFCNEPTIQGYILESELKYAVGQLVEALRYKPKGRGFDFLWCHWNFSLTQNFRPLCGPGVDSASNRNE